jgi:hypothetical protein
MSIIIPKSIYSNLGVWGLDGSPLELKIKSDIDKIVISIKTGASQFLNLQGIKAFDLEGNDIMMSDKVKNVRLSSNFYSTEDGGLDILHRVKDGSLIHSSFEQEPSVTITFKEAVHVDALVILNRTGDCGLRSQFIEIETFLANLQTSHFINVSEERVELLNNELKSIVSSKNVSFSLPKHEQSAAQHVRNLLFRLIQDGQEVSQELCEALLPVTGPEPRLDNFSALFITNFIEARLQNKSHFNTRELIRFKNLLGTDVSLEALSAFASKELSKRHTKERKVVISKHRVHYNTLIANSDLHLDFLEKVIDVLNEIDGVPLVAYGTLLGAYRDNGFLTADDDIDIIFHIDDVAENDRESLKYEILNLIKSKGLSANIQDNCPHITVNSPEDAVGVDIFLSWGNTETLQAEVVMEQLKYRAIPRKVLLPSSSIELYGRTLPSPNDPASFLADRYGEGWDRRNPYHEWPWNLKRRAFFNHKNTAKNYHDREQNRPFRFKSTRSQMVAWSQCVFKNNRPPSNSLPMILQALKVGYDVVELDVRTTGDKEVVLAHDDKLTNHLGDEIVLSKATLAEAKSFELGVFQNEVIKLPALSEALNLLKGKRVLLDARFSPDDYSILKKTVDDCSFDTADLVFCVYDETQLNPLMQFFPNSVLMWKFYTQIWEIDKLKLSQIRKFGLDGIMYMYPHYNESISDYLYEIKKNDLQSMCFIHGQHWIHPHSSGLAPNQEVRMKDDYNASLSNMVSSGIEYVTTLEFACDSFIDITTN